MILTGVLLFLAIMPGLPGIPFTVLIDKDGAILGTNLAMDELRAKLAEKLQ